MWHCVLRREHHPSHAVTGFLLDTFRPTPHHAMAGHHDSYYADDYNRTNDSWIEDSPLRTSSSTYLVPNSPAMSPMRKDSNYSTRTLGPMNGLPSYPGASPSRQRANLTKTLPRFLNSAPVSGNPGKTFTRFLQPYQQSCACAHL
jgi:hypothetical protein